MDDICSHLKISKKTLYQYFSNKDDLVEQIMMHRRNNYRTQKDIEELKEQWCLDKVFNPQMKEDTARKLLNEWHKAVGRSQNWAE